MRIFVAVALEAGLREAIAALQSRLSPPASSLRWVPPPNLHFTLKFLGQIPQDRVARVGLAAREVAGRTAPFWIALAGMGAFPSAARPRVVWIGVEDGSDRLIALAGALDAALHRMRFPREARAFRPHLTVARARDGGSAPDLSDVLRDLSGVPVGRQTVDALRVMESRLASTGATYRCVDEVRLSETR